MKRSLLFASAALVASVAAASPALADPPASDGHVESTQYPLRVYYTAAAGEAIAQEVLSLAEQAWQIQVEQMGFVAPTTEDGEGNRVPGLWLYLDPNAAYDHAEAIGDNPDTPWTDCTMRVVIRTLSPPSYLPLLTAHEMNHAFEMAADCGESPFAWENTTVAVTTLMFPDDDLFGQYFLPTFQQHPHHGLDCFFFTDPEVRYYHYGASLFQVFLEDAYGSYDGKMLASIWEAARQEGSVLYVTAAGTAELDVPNEPHLLDAMRTVLGDTTLEEAFIEFARWRYFVGLRDDGAHFTHGANWTGSELAMDTSWSLAELPLVQAVPQHDPSELGTTYVELDVAGVEADRGARFVLAADPSVVWHVDALLVRADRTADVQSMTMSDEAAGELLVEGLAEYDHVVFAISNLGSPDHNPESPNCQRGTPFTYDLDLVDLATPPSIDTVSPAQLDRGSTGYLWVEGSDFAEGLQVFLSGDGLTVGSVDYIDEATIGVDVSVAADAEPGGRDLTLTNPNGASATLTGAVEIVGPADEEAAGCDCSTLARPTFSPLGWCALLGLGLPLCLRRRRRSTD